MAKTSAATPAADNPVPQQKLVALAFDRTGSLLRVGKVSSEAAYFDLDPKQLRAARVFILPEPAGERDLKQLTLAQVERLVTFEPQLRFNKEGAIVFENIPDHIVAKWLWHRCCVRGRITNRASVEGQFETYPVCNATVHVCEVDRLWLWIEKIPPYLLERLREGLLERIPVPWPWPGPWPGPFPDGPILRDRLPEIPRPIPIPDPAFGSRAMALVNRLAVAAPVVRALAPTEQLTTLRYQLQQQDEVGLRRLLVEEFVTLQPYFCYFPYIWPYIYHCDHVATVQTDNNGRYEACFWYQKDQPDVYIWIEYPFPTGPETVYRPSIACHTRWDYACGTDFDVQLHDSRIPPICGIILQGTSVAIRAIGHSVSPMAIQQQLTAQIPVPGIANFRTVGLTNYATGGLGGYSPLLVNQHLRPYTSSFPVIAQFGDGLPATGIRYFQLQYRRTHNAALTMLINPANLNSGWKPLNSGSLSRRYSIQVGLDFQYLYYEMGPFTVGGQQVYRIPPLDPQLPGVDGVPASTDPTARWSQYDRVQIGQIATSQLDGNGLYEFRIRFLNASGNLASVNADFFRVSDPANPTTTMAAPADYICAIGGNAVFQFRLRIDNQAPTIAIEGVSLDGDDTVMTDCGFVEYDNTGQLIGIAFEASHPQDFALFGFNLERGRRLATTNHFLLGDAAGMVSGSKTPYTLGPDGKYRGSFTVSDLLAGGCGDKAAFSEVLSIVGLHTDGYNAGNFFHHSLSNAFALGPIK